MDRTITASPAKRMALGGMAGLALLAGVIAAGYFTRGAWLHHLIPASPRGQAEGKQGAAPAGERQQVRLTPQAQNNLHLVAKPLKPETFWRTLEMPGTVVDRPAYSDRSVVAPVTGLVTKVHAFPGDTVRPGDPLFTLRLLSETLHLTQTELFKNTQEIQITEEKKNRLSAAAASGTVPEARIIEIDNQLGRLRIAAKAYRQQLQIRGLTLEQIDGVAQGRFISVIEVKAPQHSGANRNLVAGLLVKPSPLRPDDTQAPTFEVQDLKVELGQQVQAGQTLGLLSNHQALYIEGRAFAREAPVVEKAAKEGWRLEVEFMEGAANGWPSLEQVFSIQHIANAIDRDTQTFAFFLALANQSRTFGKDGKTLMLWRFRPGQKVRLHIRVEKFENVFVLPADAVVREGPEAYVFRQNGDLFDRKPVRVVYQDRQHTVIANDGSIPPGLFVAQGGATQLNRALKAGRGTPAGFHVHADGTVHANH